MRPSCRFLLIALLFALTARPHGVLFAAGTSAGRDRAAAPFATVPGTYEVLSKDGRIRIPFETHRGKIRFQAEVNGKTCYLTFDNGSLWDELLFFGSPRVDSLALPRTGRTTIGGDMPADRSDGLTVGFRDVVFRGQAAVVTPYDSTRPQLWTGMDGQVSATFLKHFVVRFDFDSSMIELIPPDRFDHHGPGQVLPMKHGPHDSRTVPARVRLQDGATVGLDLLVDFGGIHPVYLPLGRRPDIRLPAGAVESSLGAGLQRQDGHLGRLRSVRLGSYRLRDVTAAFVPAADAPDIYGNTMLGLPLLQRFNFAFDYFRDRLILEPSRTFADPFLVNMTGMDLVPDADGGLRVARVYAGSAAARAGLAVDDVVGSINGRETTAYPPDEIRALLRAEGSDVRFEFRRGGSPMPPVTLRLRQIY